jgi:hypothetical protein
MPELVGFQTMGILVPNGKTFDSVDVFWPFTFYSNPAQHTEAGFVLVKISF